MTKYLVPSDVTGPLLLALLHLSPKSRMTDDAEASFCIVNSFESSFNFSVPFTSRALQLLSQGCSRQSLSFPRNAHPLKQIHRHCLTRGNQTVDKAISSKISALQDACRTTIQRALETIMASPNHHKSTTVLHSTLLYLLPLLTAFPHPTLAQSIINTAAQASLPTATPTLDDPGISNSGTAIPTATVPLTGHASSSNLNGDSSSRDVLNYYFLLIIFVAILFTAYCYVSRRRRRKAARLQGSRRLLLAQDLQGWTGARRWVHTRWRSEPRVEGLDERGEAPPPYLPERPAETHAASGSMVTESPIPLQDMHKPPDYEEGASSWPTGQRIGPAFRDV